MWSTPRLHAHEAKAVRVVFLRQLRKRSSIAARHPTHWISLSDRHRNSRSDQPTANSSNELSISPKLPNRGETKRKTGTHGGLLLAGESIARMSDSVKRFFERAMRQVIGWASCYVNHPTFCRKKPHDRHNPFSSEYQNLSSRRLRSARPATVQRGQTRSRIPKVGVQ
jgi:hypothetical protein